MQHYPNHPQQQPSYTQPGQYYPPQQTPPPGWQPGTPYGAPPPRPPKKSAKSLRFSLIIGGIIALALFACIGSALASHGSTNTSANAGMQATSAPTQPLTPKSSPTKATPKIITITSFTGHSSGGTWHDTASFSVPANWQVSWTCTSGDGRLPIVTIAAYDHAGNPIAGDDEIAARGSCSDLAGTGPVQKHGGIIHLHIYAQGDWTVHVVAVE